MNEDMENLERRLQARPVKKIPADWRAEILSAAGAAQSRQASSVALLSTLNRQLATLLWPHPKAWAGLAVVWIFILVLNGSMRDRTPALAEKVSPPSPEVLVELKQQRLLFAALIGSAQAADADRQKLFAPKPRSERGGILAA